MQDNALTRNFLETNMAESDKINKKSLSPLAVIEQMVAGINNHVIDGQQQWWHPDACWRGPAGAGLKQGLQEFQDQWQRPFLAAFPDKKANDLIRIASGKYVAAAGYQEATHSATFLGIPATGKKIRLRYMDFWEIEDGKIKDNWVLIDFIDLLRQLGVDPLQGHGMDNNQWDAQAFDRGGAAWPPPSISTKEKS